MEREEIMSKPLSDPREIRKALQRTAYRGGRISDDRQDSMGLPLVRAVLNMCESLGYSGEDTMTVLAYHALLAYENLLDAERERLVMSINPPIFVLPKVE